MTTVNETAATLEERAQTSSSYVGAPILPRIAIYTGVLIPTLSFALAIYFLWTRGIVHWAELGLFFGFYLLTGFGITVGYHRLFAHRSFEAHPITECVLGILGSMALMGPLISWVAIHRRHHQCSDTLDDPHSPHKHGSSLFGLLRGWWYAHAGWFIVPTPMELSSHVKDLQRIRWIRAIDDLFYLWVALGILIPGALGAWIIGGWDGFLAGMLWGGLARIFWVHHITWSINSICHIWGRQPHTKHDHSKNNVLFGIFGLGEGWHNNHHAFPTSARHGLRWWQFDSSYCVICVMGWFGLARNIKLANPRLSSHREGPQEESVEETSGQPESV